MGLLADTATSVTSARTHHTSKSKMLKPRSLSRSRVRSRSRSRVRSRSRSRAYRSERSRSRSRASRSGIGHAVSRSVASIFDTASHHHSSHSHHRHVSPRRHHANSSRSSIFNFGTASRGSIFGSGGSRTPSFYKRSPRPSFLHRTYKKAKRLLRDLVHHARRHPIKVLMLVLIPLAAGGALAALLARLGIRLPPTVAHLISLAARTFTGDGALALIGEAIHLLMRFLGAPSAMSGAREGLNAAGAGTYYASQKTMTVTSSGTGVPYPGPSHSVGGGGSGYVREAAAVHYQPHPHHYHHQTWQKHQPPPRPERTYEQDLGYGYGYGFDTVPPYTYKYNAYLQNGPDYYNSGAPGSSVGWGEGLSGLVKGFF